jgi:hypothetical protein
MQDETKSKGERHEDASSMTKRVTGSPVERKSHALTLAPGDRLSGLSVFQIDQPHQHCQRLRNFWLFQLFGEANVIC